MDITAQISLTILQATQLAALSRSYLYEAIQRGELPIRKAGRRTLVLRQDLENWLNSLPRGNRDSKQS
jgi:excisionase family DNA binding protein